MYLFCFSCRSNVSTITSREQSSQNRWCHAENLRRVCIYHPLEGMLYRDSVLSRSFSMCFRVCDNLWLARERWRSPTICGRPSAILMHSSRGWLRNRISKAVLVDSVICVLTSTMPGCFLAQEDWLLDTVSRRLWGALLDIAIGSPELSKQDSRIGRIDPVLTKFYQVGSCHCSQIDHQDCQYLS